MEITMELSRIIDFAPSTTRAEIIQNVRMISTTIKKTIPMAREFGISDVLDERIQIARAKLTSEVADAIKRYETRAKLVSIDFSGNATDGEMNPLVTIEI